MYVFKHSEHILHLIIITLRFFSADYLFKTTERAHFKVKILLLSFFSVSSMSILSTPWHQRTWTSHWTEARQYLFKSKFLFFFNHFSSASTSLTISVKLSFCNYSVSDGLLRPSAIESELWWIAYLCNEFNEFNDSSLL